MHGAYIVSFSVESIVLLHQYFPQYVCAVPNMAVFCSSFTSCFPGMLLTYFLDDFEIVPVVPIVTVIPFVFTFHMRCISIVRSLYFRIFSASFLITFLSPEIAASINIHVPFSLSRIIMSGLFWGIVLSVCTCWFHNMVALPCLALPILAHVHTGVFVQLYPCFLAYVEVQLCTHSIMSLCTVLLPVLGMLILCGLLSHQIVGKVCICHLSLCSIFLSRNILFVTPGLVLPLIIIIIITIVIIIKYCQYFV